MDLPVTTFDHRSEQKNLLRPTWISITNTKTLAWGRFLVWEQGTRNQQGNWKSPKLLPFDGGQK